MSTTPKRSNTLDPSSPVLNNWIFVRYSDGTFARVIMDFYTYLKVRKNIKLGINKEFKYLQIIKPRDPMHWLKINKLDDRAMESFLNRIKNEHSEQTKTN